MKKTRDKLRLKTIVLLLILIYPFLAESQVAGVRFGYTGTTLYNTQVRISESQFGYSIGGYGSLDLGPVNLSLEIMYANMHTANLDPAYLYDVENSLSGRSVVASTAPIFRTLAVPLFVNYYFYKQNDIKVKISLGSSFDFNLQSLSANTYVTNYDNSSSVYLIKEGLGSKIKTFDMGIIAGIGSDFAHNNLVYSIDIRYRYGLSNINTSESITLIDNKFTKDGVFIMFGVGYKLSFGGSNDIGTDDF